METMFHFQSGMSFEEIKNMNLNAKVLQKNLPENDIHRWLPEGYSFGTLIDCTGTDANQNGIWFSYDDARRNFHITPVNAGVCTAIGVFLDEILKRVNPLQICQSNYKKHGNPPDYTQNHKMAWINVGNYQYLASFNRLVNEDGVINNYFGKAQFMRYRIVKDNIKRKENEQNINWIDKDSGFIIYPDDSMDCSNYADEVSGHAVYNAPFSFDQAFDIDEIAFYFARFIKGKIKSIPALPEK